MKILYYTGDLNSGGAQRQLIYTAVGMADLGHNVKVVINYPIYHYGIELREKNIEVICTNTTNKNILRRLIRLNKIIKEYNPDVLHSFLGLRNLEAMIIAYKNRIKCRFASIRNVSKNEFKYFFLYYCLSTKIITNSAKAKQELLKIYRHINRNKIVVILNGIDLNLFKNCEDKSIIRELIIKYELEKKIIGIFIGRIEYQKNHIIFFEVLARLKKNGLLDDKIKILIIGKINDVMIYNQLIKIVKKNGIKGNIEFVGERRDVPFFLNFSNFLVLPSIFEGFPNVVMEAMASKTFPLATDVGGTSELIHDGETGILMKSPNFEDIYEGFYRYLIMKKEEKNLIINNCTNFIKNFTISNMVNRTLNIYKYNNS